MGHINCDFWETQDNTVAGATKLRGCLTLMLPCSDVIWSQGVYKDGMAAPTFLVFSNCEEILVIMPSAATKDSRDSTCGKGQFPCAPCVTSMRAKTTFC